MVACLKGRANSRLYVDSIAWSEAGLLLSEQIVPAFSPSKVKVPADAKY